MISFICRTSEKVGAGILVDVDKLRKKIAENKLNIASIANRIGIDRATFYRKLSGKGMNFTIREADMIAKELGLDKDEAVCIFFWTACRRYEKSNKRKEVTNDDTKGPGPSEDIGAARV